MENILRTPRSQIRKLQTTPWKIGQKIETLCRGGNTHSQVTWEEICSALLMIRELQRKHSKIFFTHMTGKCCFLIHC